MTVRLHGKGVCKSAAENLQLGATQYFYRQKGQLIYGKQNFHNGAIGIIPKELDGGITSKDIPSFDIDTSRCNPQYLLHQMLSPKFYRAAEALTTGTGSKRLSESTFLKLHVAIPELKEQNDVAFLMDAVSCKLSLEKEVLILFLKQKQYLLQQLFI